MIHLIVKTKLMFTNLGARKLEITYEIVYSKYKKIGGLAYGRNKKHITFFNPK